MDKTVARCGSRIAKLRIFFHKQGQLASTHCTSLILNGSNGARIGAVLDFVFLAGSPAGAGCAVHRWLC